MPFDIQLDYRFDSTGFFDDPDARAALEKAVGIWESILLDEFDDVPAGISFEIDDPSQSGTGREIVLDQPIDDLLIFVGAEPISGPLAFGGFDGTGIGGVGLGDAYASRITGNFRDQGPVTDFEPWVGTISYDTGTDWSFALDTPEPRRADFISVTLHEIGHVLGFGTAAIFDEIGAGQSFDGPNALRVNAGDPIPLQAGLGHVENGFAMDSVLMDPSLTNGSRVLPSDIDKAMLADIGWEIAGFEAQGSTPPIATDGGETIFGSAVGEALDGLGGPDFVQGRGGDDDLQGGAGQDTVLGGEGNDTVAGGAGGDQLQGGAGDDDLRGDTGADTLLGGEGNDTLSGGEGDDQLQGGAGADLLLGGTGSDRLAGQDGTDVFRVVANGGTVRITDLELGFERIEIEGSGFADDAAAIAAITKPFGNVSRLTFVDGTQLDVVHVSTQGTPLTVDNISVLDPFTAGPAAITGTGDSEELTGTAAAEVLRGLGGNDTLDGGAGADTVEGGAGTDSWAASGSQGVRVDLLAGTARDGFGATDRLVSIENAQGGAGADLLTGDDGDNRLTGGGGGDTLDGGAGADTLDGGTGDDRYILDGADQLIERAGAGRDTVVSAQSVNLGSAEIEVVTLTGSANARVTGNGGATGITGNAGANVLIGGGGGDVLAGGGGGDVFAFLASDLDGAAARITDFETGDRIALDDRLFGLGGGRVEVRDVTQGQVRAAIENERAFYDGQTGALSVDLDGRGGGGGELLLTLEGGGRIGAEDLLLF